MNCVVSSHNFALSNDVDKTDISVQKERSFKSTVMMAIVMKMRPPINNAYLGPAINDEHTKYDAISQVRCTGTLDPQPSLLLQNTFLLI